MLGSRLDFPGALHHVYARAIAGLALFRDDLDRARFLTRVSRVFRESGLVCIAWALMETHFHFAVITGSVPLWKAMQRIEDGYAKEYNLKYGHTGHVFQGRYGSILVDSDRYCRNLQRYIHRNPLEANAVADLDALAAYAWTGHAAAMGGVRQPFHDVNRMLEAFGSDPAVARLALLEFMDGPSDSELFESPTRIVTPWGNEAASIVGSDEFVEAIVAAADPNLRIASAPRRPAANLRELLSTFGLPSPSSREPSVYDQRVAFARAAVLEYGFRRYEVAKFLRLSPSAVCRYVAGG